MLPVCMQVNLQQRFAIDLTRLQPVHETLRSFNDLWSWLCPHVKIQCRILAASMKIPPIGQLQLYALPAFHYFNFIIS